jgi:hypothetical protein
MARISNAEVSNFDQSKELAVITKQSLPLYWPKVSRPSK